ncbi:MAG: Lrp/AsnC family transcriptional regulator [Candidatus Aenigmatarchaeota archaeon]
MKTTEKKVLLELLENSRKKITEIAEAVGISRQTVSKKIEKLDEEGIIDFFTVSLDEKKLGLNVRAYVILNLDPSSELRQEFVQEAKDFEKISQIHYTFGRFDMVMEVLVEDEEELDGIISRIHDFEAVEETETLICRYTEKRELKAPVREFLTGN